MSDIIYGNFIAIEPPVHSKVEAEIVGGIAITAQRINLIKQKVKLAQTALSLVPGDEVIIQADIVLEPWAKRVFNLNGVSFVLIPIDRIIGYSKKDQ